MPIYEHIIVPIILLFSFYEIQIMIEKHYNKNYGSILFTRTSVMEPELG